MTIKKVQTKSGTVWKVRVDMGRTLSGARDQKQVTCATKREAERVQSELVAMRDATRGRSGRITLEAYVEQWYRPLMQSLAATSRDTYDRELRLRIIPSLGGVDVRDITRARIQRMVDSCKTEGVARKALGVLKTVLNEARADGIIVTNPACLRYKMPPKGRKRDNGLVIGTFAEMRPVFDAVARYDDDGTVAKLCATGLLMGLRPEERYGLDWGDFDWQEGCVHIRRAYLQASGAPVLKEPKTENGRRAVPVPDDAARILRGLQRHGNVIETGPFLRGADGHRLSPSTGRKRWERFLRRCDAQGVDVPHVTLENMRHSFATSFLAAGGNVENLSRILGHADINTTFRRYVRPSAGNLRADMERVRIAL